ncbi:MULTISPECIES: hypothetical protein [unclassified Streptomyces]|uniref:hypothetical protein n=1 Tax=unclassified Streptomyces TaxID=2593676 RepID=UPI00369953D6
MPPRSKDTAFLKRFAADHARAHARLATVRPDAACACRARQCALHEERVQCTGATLLVLVHNAAVGQVWTVAEVCQACAPLIPHMSVLGRAQRPVPVGAAASTSPVSTPPNARPAPAPVPGGFSSPQAAPESPTGRRGPRRDARRRRAS